MITHPKRRAFESRSLAGALTAIWLTLATVVAASVIFGQASAMIDEYTAPD